MRLAPDHRAGNIPKFTPTTPSAIVVEETFTEALPIVSFLVGCQFYVTVAGTFGEAKNQMAQRPPTLLITEVRLAEYNGLGLVLRGKSRQPTMAAVVTSSVDDPVLQADAEAMGATFVLKPLNPRDLQAATLRTLFRGGHHVGTEPIRAPYERRRGERRKVVQTDGSRERRTAERRRDLASLIAASALRRLKRP